LEVWTSKADTGEADTSKAESGKADAAEAETSKADAGEPDAGEPDDSEPEDSESDDSEPEDSEAKASEVATQPFEVHMDLSHAATADAQTFTPELQTIPEFLNFFMRMGHIQHLHSHLENLGIQPLCQSNGMVYYLPAVTSQQTHQQRRKKQRKGPDGFLELSYSPSHYGHVQSGYKKVPDLLNLCNLHMRLTWPDHALKRVHTIVLKLFCFGQSRYSISHCGPDFTRWVQEECVREFTSTIEYICPVYLLKWVTYALFDETTHVVEGAGLLVVSKKIPNTVGYCQRTGPERPGGVHKTFALYTNIMHGPNLLTVFDQLKISWQRVQMDKTVDNLADAFASLNIK
jgi:uncharacterized membrane protein YecN with MAPEG domain